MISESSSKPDGRSKREELKNRSSPSFGSVEIDCQSLATPVLVVHDFFHHPTVQYCRFFWLPGIT